MLAALGFELIVTDEREVVTDEIKVPIPLKCADRFEDGPSFADKVFQSESGEASFFSDLHSLGDWSEFA